MTTLTAENNRITARNAREQDFTSFGYLHARRAAEMARAEVVADLFTKIFRHAPERSRQESVVSQVHAGTASPFDHFSRAEREQMARAMVIGESLGNGLKAAGTFLGKLFAAPKQGAAPLSVDLSRFSHLDVHRQAEIERALYIGQALSDGIAAVERFVRDRLVAPLGRAMTRQRLMSELSGLSDRTLADIGVRRIDIPSVAKDAYPIYVADGSEAEVTEAVPAVDPRMPGKAENPANDDDARRHVA